MLFGYWNDFILWFCRFRRLNWNKIFTHETSKEPSIYKLFHSLNEFVRNCLLVPKIPTVGMDLRIFHNIYWRSTLSRYSNYKRVFKSKVLCKYLAYFSYYVSSQISKTVSEVTKVNSFSMFSSSFYVNKKASCFLKIKISNSFLLKYDIRDISN